MATLSPSADNPSTDRGPNAEADETVAGGTVAGAPSSFLIDGRTVTLPVQVRDAANWSAQYLVPKSAAQRIVAPTGLEVAEPVPGRAMLALAFVRYEDTDLDRYHEVAMSFVVRRHDATPAGLATRLREVPGRQSGVYIHQLPVDQTFTLAAGTSIWGYPKFLAEIDIDEDERSATCRLEHDGQHVLTLRVAKGGPVRLPTPAMPTYTWRDGRLRVTEWETNGTGLGGHVGGAHLTLGHHPIAHELRTLGLPRRAAMSSSVDHVRATFGAARVVGAGG
jgi:Acetoacetate decarboxylase (ADC)